MCAFAVSSNTVVCNGLIPSGQSGMSAHSQHNSLDFENEIQYLKTGTTIVGICCLDGVVLGADTRSTGGPLIMDKNKLKIHDVSDRIYCCAAGTSADCDQVSRITKRIIAMNRNEQILAEDGDNLDSIFHSIHSISNLLFDRSRHRKAESSFIIGGIDNSGPSLHQITEDGTNRVGFAALGSGSIDALAILETKRKEWGEPLQNYGYLSAHGDDEKLIERICVDDAIDVVRQAVRGGIMNDLGSGSHIDICVIRKDSVDKWREESNK